MSGAPRTALVVGDETAVTRAATESPESDATPASVAARLSRVDGVTVERTDEYAPADGPDSDGADLDAVFAVGESSLLGLAADPPDCPVFAIGAGVGRYDVSVDAIEAAVDAFGTGTFETVSHPVLAVDVDGEPVGSAVADVSLVTAEPARISEFAVGSDGWSDTVRADGVVVATPLGSEGYAHAVGGPLLAPGTGLAAVPISPYAMHADVWVLRPPVSLSVERDEAAVSLLLDDTVAQSVPAGTPIRVAVGASLSLARPGTIGTD